MGESERKRDATTEAEIGVMCFEMEKGARHEGMQVASKEFENGSSRALRRNSALLIPCFSPVRPILNFCLSEL